MKKLILSLAVLMAAGTVSAQDKVVRKARDLQIEVQNLMANKQRDEKETAQMQQKMQQCIEMIESTLTSDLTVKEKANAWDIKASMEMYQFSPEVDKIIAKQPFDTLAFATHLYASLDAMEQCYKIEKETGRLKKEENYSKVNVMRVIQFQNYVAPCGQYFSNNGDQKRALDAFERWMSFPETYTILELQPQVQEQLRNDEQRPMIAFFTAFTAYNLKDWKTFSKYIDLAQNYAEQHDAAVQLRLQAFVEQGDTATWLTESEKACIANPDANEALAQNLIAYYFNHDKVERAMTFLEQLIAKEPESKMANYAMGVALYNKKDYSKAIPYFDKAIEIDPEYVDAYYNAGVCYSNIGYEINEKLNSSNKKVSQAEWNKSIQPVKDNYKKAEPYFLKVKELRPNDSDLWAGRLSIVYYILGDKKKQAEYDKYNK